MQGELRRQLTAAGMYLEMYGPAWSPSEPTNDEAEQLMVWLDAWQEGRDEQLPAGWELTRHVWCPRCDRDADPLGWWHDFSGNWKGRPYGTVFPSPPLLEIGPGCQGGMNPYFRFQGAIHWHDHSVDALPGWWWVACSTRRVFRWGLRRA